MPVEGKGCPSFDVGTVRCSPVGLFRLLQRASPSHPRDGKGVLKHTYPSGSVVVAIFLGRSTLGIPPEGKFVYSPAGM